jgi:GNAT superfamily N-acetyltransferase
MFANASFEIPLQPYFDMMHILRTDSTNPDFQGLVKLLDAELAIRDGADHDFYHQFNGITMLKNVVVLFHENIPAACGAFKPLETGEAEVKRMYTHENYRGNGYAIQILAELETWATELGFKTCVLETGKAQPEAIALYHKTGYHVIPNYGQYVGVENSICFEKELN